MYLKCLEQNLPLQPAQLLYPTYTELLHPASMHVFFSRYSSSSCFAALDSISDNSALLIKSRIGVRSLRLLLHQSLIEKSRRSKIGRR
jgi:hypothetical protein